MNWFKQSIAVLVLLATASAFYLTASRMNPHLLSFTPQKEQTAAAIITHIPHRETISSPSPEVPTQTATSTPEQTLPRKDEVTISDKTLDNAVSSDKGGIEATYEYSLDTVAKDIHTRSNIARSQNNLPPLTFDNDLTAIAQSRSDDMVKHDYFSHTAQDGCDLACRFKSFRYPSLVLGENLAEFSDYTSLSEDDLAQTFVDDWIKSSEHRQNLLSTGFSHEGVGVAIKDKRIVVTVIFARP